MPAPGFAAAAFAFGYGKLDRFSEFLGHPGEEVVLFVVVHVERDVDCEVEFIVGQPAERRHPLPQQGQTGLSAQLSLSGSGTAGSSPGGPTRPTGAKNHA
jgi:hypothetical protein